MTTAVPAAAMGAGLLVALAAGTVPFAVVVVLLAAALLVDFTSVLSSAGPRPVVLAAAVPGVGLPATVVVREDAWAAVPDLVAAGVLAAFVVVLVFGRRRDVTGALGATAIAGLVVGLGSGGLLLLRSLPDGFRWVLGVVVVVAMVDAARQLATPRIAPLPAGAATVAAALLSGAGLSVALDPPFGVASAAGVAAVALLATAASALLREAVDDAVASETADRGVSGAPPAGVLAAAAMPVLLAAPAAYALARLAAL